MSFEMARELAESLENDGYCGLTRDTFFGWLASKGRQPEWPPAPADRDSCLIDTFWVPYGCSALPNYADAVAFQMVINLPERRAKQIIQAAVQVTPDGAIGPATRAALQKCADVPQFVASVLGAQLTHYLDMHDPGDGVYEGLLGRVGKVWDWWKINWQAPAPSVQLVPTPAPASIETLSASALFAEIGRRLDVLGAHAGKGD